MTRCHVLCWTRGRGRGLCCCTPSSVNNSIHSRVCMQPCFTRLKPGDQLPMTALGKQTSTRTQCGFAKQCITVGSIETASRNCHHKEQRVTFTEGRRARGGGGGIQAPWPTSVCETAVNTKHRPSNPVPSCNRFSWFLFLLLMPPG